MLNIWTRDTWRYWWEHSHIYLHKFNYECVSDLSGIIIRFLWFLFKNRLHTLTGVWLHWQEHLLHPTRMGSAHLFRLRHCVHWPGKQTCWFFMSCHLMITCILKAINTFKIRFSGLKNWETFIICTIRSRSRAI